MLFRCPRMVRIEEIQDQSPTVLKDRGNQLFKEKKYEEAASEYSEALSADCPEDLRATLLFNRATCWFYLGDYEDCANDCSESLKLNPQYVKALYRRALAREQLGQLQEAVADFDALFALDSALRAEHLSHYKNLSSKRDAKFESDKEEAMASLKSLGNSLLGNFGLSLDQFKFDKDPVTGNYSVRMDSAS